MSFARSALAWLAIAGCLSILGLSPPIFADDGALESVLASIDGPAPPEAPEVLSRDADGKVTLRAVRVSAPITVDGRLEESDYQRVPAIEGFVQQEPRAGDPASEPTEVWLFFDDKNVYVSARCWDSNPDRMMANELRRDSRGIFNNDNFAVIFDTFYDRRNGFLFHTNPLGALYDAQVTDERNVNSDWNTVWYVKTSRFAEGWTVEMAIPFKSLRYQAGSIQLWGVNFRRIVRSKNELSYLTPIDPGFRERGLLQVSRAATVVGIEVPSKSVNLELKPYVTSGLRTDLDATAPFENDFEADVGFDTKYGVTKGLIADFTLHTDFAQVEADDQQVNLTRFGLFFPEKREFFLEGQGIFAFGGAGNSRGGGGGGGGGDEPILFFSRRIGIEEVDDETFQVPIRAGGRLTGRAGKYTLGLLNIQTGSNPNLGMDQGTNFSAVRVKRDILRRSNIGVIATHRNRAADSPGSNSVFGVDAGFTFFENLNINAYYAETRTEGLAGKDASYFGQIRYGGDRFGFNLGHLNIGDAFNPEIGFVRRDDIRKSNARVRLSHRPRSLPAVRRFSVVGQMDYFERQSVGQVETRQGEVELQTEFSSGDQVQFTYENNYEFLFDPFEITDEVTLPVGGYPFRRFRVAYEMGPQRAVSGWWRFNTGGFFSGTRTEVGYGGRVEVTPQFSLEPDVSQNWVRLEEGDFTTTLLRVRGTYSLSARSFVGALAQYNTSNDTFTMNVRLRWEYQPGSDFFVVYTDGRDLDGTGFPALRNQSLVVKFTRLFRF